MHSKSSRSSNAIAQSRAACSLRNIIITIASIAIGWSLFISVKVNMNKPLSQPTTGSEAIVVEDHNETLVKTAEVESYEGNLHVVFSTDCTFFQDWQSLVMFYSAVAVGQKGPITRIASGCNSEKKEVLTKLYAKLFPQYFIHFTPDFKTDKETSNSYEFYNKPYGVEHWLENADPIVPDGVVIAILDPDMMFLRPLTTKIQTENSLFLAGSTNIPTIIKKGVPSAQLYGLGAPWTDERDDKFNRTEVCGPGSPCLKVSYNFGERFYSVGPPYILEKTDLHRLTKSWTKFVPRVYKRYPELLAEMYAYSMAGAHEELPHFTVMHHMVSNTDMPDEGWFWVDALEDKVCEAPVVSSTADPQTGILGSMFYPNRNLPTLMHYCQFFRIAELGFQKRRVTSEMMKCDFPMLMTPALDLGKNKYKNRDGDIMPLSRMQARRNAFAINIIHRSINMMLHYYKDNMCPEGYNQEKTINVIKWPQSARKKKEESQ